MVSDLVLDHPGRKVRLERRVVRSTVDRAETTLRGEQEFISHTGLEFLEPSPETQLAISERIE